MTLDARANGQTRYCTVVAGLTLRLVALVPSKYRWATEMMQKGPFGARVLLARRNRHWEHRCTSAFETC